MDLENTLPTSICDIVSSNGSLIATTKVAILPQKIVVFDTKISISLGDEIRRKLPGGHEEVFEVTDPKFFQGFHGTKAHYQLVVPAQGHVRAWSGRKLHGPHAPNQQKR